MLRWFRISLKTVLPPTENHQFFHASSLMLSYPNRFCTWEAIAPISCNVPSWAFGLPHRRCCRLVDARYLLLRKERQYSLGSLFVYIVPMQSVPKHVPLLSSVSSRRASCAGLWYRSSTKSLRRTRRTAHQSLFAVEVMRLVSAILRLIHGAIPIKLNGCVHHSHLPLLSPPPPRLPDGLVLVGIQRLLLLTMKQSQASLPFGSIVRNFGLPLSKLTLPVYDHCSTLSTYESLVPPFTPLVWPAHFHNAQPTTISNHSFSSIA